MTDSVLLEGAHSRAHVHPVGATVVSWVPNGRDDVLWVAPGARFEEGRAIRGGIPLVWPWFADAGTPSHGLVRARTWTLTRQAVVDGVAHAEWGFEHDDGDWAFNLTYRVQVGEDLVLELEHEDCSGRPRSVGGALHTYFRLDPARAKVQGLDAEAWDKNAQRSVRVSGPRSLQGPQDLVVPHEGPVTLETGDHRVHIEGRNHRDVVLWNPGGAAVSDLSPGDEGSFACVETAIVSSMVEVGARGRVSLGVRYRLAP